MKKKKLNFQTLRGQHPWRRLLSLVILLSFAFTANGQILVDEDFSGSVMPAGWDTTDLTGSGSWAFDNPDDRTINGGATNFDTAFAIFDSDFICATNENATVTTPAFDASSGSIILEFDNSFREWGSQEGHVEVWDGSAWTDVLTLSGDDDGYPTANHKTIDITAAAGGSTAAKVRFHWSNGSCDYWWAIDNVLIKSVSCVAPPAVVSGNVLDVSATIAWTPSSSAPANGYEYYYATNNTAPTATSTPSGSTLDTFANLTGLSAGTTYYFWVRAACGSMDVSDWSPMGSFTTQPSMQTPATIPYTEDFATNNWTLRNGTETNQWFIGSAAGNPGNSLYVSDDGGTTNHYDNSTGSVVFAFRDITFPAGVGAFSFSFNWQCEGEGASYPYDYFRVWLVPASYLPTPGTQMNSASSGAIQIGTIFNFSDNWDTAQFVIPGSVAGATSRLVFEWRNDGGSGSQPPAAIDNIQITEISCSTPINGIVSNITANGATFSWDGLPTAPANGYDYYYNTTGTAPTAGTAASGNVTDTFVNLSGLTPSTQYYIWVRAMCSATDSSDWSSAYSFYTPQIPATLPYNEDFTAGGTGWSLFNGSQPNQWFIGSAAGNPGNSLYISDDGGTTNHYDSDNSSVVHAFRDITFTSGASAYSLSFDWQCAGEGSGFFLYDYLEVWLVPIGYMPTAGTEITSTNSGGTKIGDYYNFSDNWDTVKVTLPSSLAGATHRLVFQWHNDGSSGLQPPPAIDNIHVAAITCLAPGTPSVTNITTNSATVSWPGSATAPANGYDYYYNTTGTAPTAGTTASGNVTDTFVNLSGLTAATQYYVWVRSICSATDTSDWSPAYAFYTQQVPATLPYNEDFTAGGTGWSLFNGTEPNKWFVGNAAGNPGNSLFVSDDGGTTNHYDNDNSSVVHAFRDITFSSGAAAYSLSFDWQCGGEGSGSYIYDYLEVWLVPLSYTPVAGTEITSTNSGGTIIGDYFNNSNNWDTAQFTLPASLAGATHRLVFQWHNDGSSGSQPPPAIDNIHIAAMTCVAPGTPSVTNITANSATVSWPGLATAPTNGYDYYYNTTGTAPTAGTTASGNVTDTFVNLSGLTAATQYYVWVRSMCSATDTSDWTSSMMFTTLCDAATIPYYMPLSTTTAPALPDCVTDQLINPSGYWETEDNPGSGFTGMTLVCHYTSSGSGPADDWIYTRGLNLTAGVSYTLHYRYGNNSTTYQEKLAVKYGTAPTADSMLTLLADHTNIDDATPHDTSLTFTPTASDVYYIGFQSHSDENQYYLYVDSIYVIETITCSEPDSLQVANITAGTADLSWSGSAANYTLEYDTAGFALGTGNTVSVNGNSYTVTGLDPNTDYDFYVRSICTPGSDSSDYSAVASFQTICDIVTVSLGNDTAICGSDSLTLDAGNPGSSYLWNDNSTAQTLSVSSAGDYYVTVTNEFGCSGADTITVTMGTIPTVDLGSDTAICEGDTLTLDAGNAGSSYIWNDNSTAQTLSVSSAGDYSVTVTNTDGCSAADTVTITTNPLPSATDIQAVDQGNGSYAFSVTGASNVTTYTWNFGDNSATETGSTANHTYSESGTYTVTVILSNDCGADTLTKEVVATVGIHEVTLSRELLKIYPNPAHNSLTILNSSDLKMEQITVYNILGQVVYTATVPDHTNEYKMNVSHMASGFYTLRIRTNDGFIMRKFEVQK